METKSKIITIPARRENLHFTCETHPDVSSECTDGYYDVGEITRLHEVITPNSTRNKHEWKAFEHYKCCGANPSSHSGFDLYLDYWGYPPHLAKVKINDPWFGYYQYMDGYEVAPYGDAGRPIQGLQPFMVQRDDGGFVPPPPDLEKLKALALRSMLPTIKSQLSILNSIYELKDFRHPAERALQILRSGNFKAILRNLTKPLRGLSLRKVLQMAAGGHLQMQFNILPLISDIRATYRALTRASARINELVSRAGRLQNKHWMLALNEFTDSTDVSQEGPWEYYALGTQRVNSTRTVTHDPSVFHAQIQYNYNYTEYQLAHAQVLGLLDALGIQLNPSIIWNAIPWSFVVDWFGNVSQLFSSLKMENMKPKINICRFCWSISRKRTITIEKGISWCKFPRYNSRNQLPTVFETSYRRGIDMPAASSFEMSGLSPMELSLGVSLAITHRRRHKPCPI